MSANNRNKNSKELTLQEIIQKSALRKNIDSLSINQPHNNLTNNGQFLFTNVKSVTSAKNNLNINNFITAQLPIPKNQPADFQKIQHILSKNSTARTTNSFKQTYIYNLQTLPNNNKNTPKDSQKSKQFKSSTQLAQSLQKRKDSSKSKIKKQIDYLCVKGSSSNPLNFKISNDLPQKQIFTQNGIKNYQTLVQISSQVKKKQISTQFSTINGKSQENKKHHSFMLTKYTTSNNFRQRSTKTIQNKKIYNKNIPNNFILPEEFIDKKILFRGIKTEEKKRVRIYFDEQNKKQTQQKTDKVQILKPINSQNSPIKQKIVLNNTILKTDKFFKNIVEQNQNKKIDKKESPSKQASQICLKQTKTKGFRGTKVKSISVGQKIKPKYFIPDFLKPSLDMVMFDKKIIQVIKTQENQIQMLENLRNEHLNNQNKNINQQIQFQDQIQTDQKLSQLLLCMKAVPKMKQPKSNEVQYTIDLIQGQRQDEIKKIEDENEQIRAKKNFKSKGKGSLRNNKFQNHQICGWQDYEKSGKKGKASKFAMGQLFDY